MLKKEPKKVEHSRPKTSHMGIDATVVRKKIYERELVKVPRKGQPASERDVELKPHRGGGALRKIARTVRAFKCTTCSTDVVR